MEFGHDDNRMDDIVYSVLCFYTMTLVKGLFVAPSSARNLLLAPGIAPSPPPNQKKGGTAPAWEVVSIALIYPGQRIYAAASPSSRPSIHGDDAYL